MFLLFGLFFVLGLFLFPGLFMVASVFCATKIGIAIMRPRPGPLGEAPVIPSAWVTQPKKQANKVSGTFPQLGLLDCYRPFSGITINRGKLNGRQLLNNKVQLVQKSQFVNCLPPADVIPNALAMPFSWQRVTTESVLLLLAGCNLWAGPGGGGGGDKVMALEQ